MSEGESDGKSDGASAAATAFETGGSADDLDAIPLLAFAAATAARETNAKVKSVKTFISS